MKPTHVVRGFCTAMILIMFLTGKTQNPQFISLASPPDSLDTLSILRKIEILDEYYQNHPDAQEGGPQQDYEIWKKFTVPRMNLMEGTTEDHLKHLKNYVSNPAAFCANSGTFPSNWTSDGPINSDARKGRVNKIWVDPSNGEHILAGCTGGVWELNGSGAPANTWVCITDNATNPLALLEITGIAVNPLSTGPDITIGCGGGMALGVANRNRSTKLWVYDDNLRLAFQNAIGSSNTQNLSIGDLKYEPSGNLYVTVRNCLFKRPAGSTNYNLLYKANSKYNLGQILLQQNNNNILFLTARLVNSNQGEVFLTRNLQNAVPTFTAIGDVLNAGNVFLDENIPSQHYQHWIAQNANCSITTTSITFSSSANPVSAYRGLADYPSFGFSPNSDWRIEMDVTVTGAAVDLEVKLDQKVSETDATPTSLSSGTDKSYAINFHLNTGVNHINEPINSPDWFAYLLLTANNHSGSSIQVTNLKLISKTALNYVGDLPQCATCNKAFFLVRSNALTVSALYGGNSRNTIVEYDIPSGSVTYTSNEVPDCNQSSIAVSPSNNNNIYLGYGGWSPGVLFYTVNKGQSVNAITTYSSFCGGMVTHADIRSLLLYHSSSTGEQDDLLVGTDGGIMRTRTRTLVTSPGTYDCSNFTWENYNKTGLNTNLIFDFSTAENEEDRMLFSALDNGTMAHTKSYGNNWDHITGGDGEVCAIDKWSGQQGAAIISSGDNSGGWISFGSVYPAAGGNIPSPPEINNNSHTLNYQLASDKLLYASKEVYEFNGTSWNTLFGNSSIENLPNPSTVNDIWFADDYKPTTNEVSYYAVLSNGTVILNRYDITSQSYQLSTKNLNNYWITSKLLRPTCVVADPDHPNRVWVGISGYLHWQLDAEPETRVLYSETSGDNWTDITFNHTTHKGLPFFPVTKLVYQRGSEDIIYAATDAGVYVWNKNLDGGTWECFNNHIPYGAMITDMEIVYCENKLKIATWGRGTWETPLPTEGNYQERELSIDYPTVFSSSKTIFQNIRIQPGASLTIQGSGTVINMTANTKIIVEPQGSLIVNGAKITNACARWQGIRMQGDLGRSQYAVSGITYQPKVILQNNASIENAQIGIQSVNGGIVQASNSNFRNNNIDVAIWIYRNFTPSNPLNIRPDLSYIKNCNFFTTEIFSDNSKPLHHCSLWAVQGISIDACHFENSTNHNLLPRGNGIFSVDANFTVGGCTYNVLGNCISNHPSTFKNLTYGVLAERVYGNFSYQVDKCHFENCEGGILNSAVNNAMITRNEFVVGVPKESNQLAYLPFGVMIRKGTGFRIEENTFTRNAESFLTVGAVINQSGPNNNIVYKNTFNGLGISNLATGYNRALIKQYGSFPGLAYLCNQHSSSTFYDIAVVDTGIREYQAVVQNVTNTSGQIQTQLVASAGNTFTCPAAANSELNIFNNSLNNFSYYWDGSGTQCSTNPKFPDATSLSTVIVPNIPVNSNECLSRFSRRYGTVGIKKLSETDRIALSDWRTKLKSKLDQYTFLYHQLIDGGNTANVKDDVKNGTDQNVLNLRASLLAESPFLSTAVLREVSENTAFPAAMAFEIIAANPKAIKEQDFENFLRSKTQPMDEWMIELLKEFGEDSVSAREILENHIIQTQADYQFSINLLNADNLYLESDSNEEVDQSLSGPDWNNFHELLTEGNSYQYEYERADNQLQEGNFSGALETIDSIKIKYSLTDLEEAERHGMAQLFEILIAVISDGRNLMQFTNSEKESIINLYNNSFGIAHQRACNILSLIDTVSPCIEETFLPTNNSEKRSNTEPAKTYKRTAGSLVVQPNPVNKFIQYHYAFPGDCKSGILECSDYLGHVIFKEMLNKTEFSAIIDCDSWPEGAYTITVSSNCGYSELKKIVVRH
ncbi:MAG: hypothetical protein U0T73_00095 [Chitinophagales bacterium]